MNFPSDVKRSWTNNAFSAGEKLVFDVDYAFINAGKAEMYIDSVVTFNKAECLRLISTTSSNKTFDYIFKVRDRVESYIDKKGVFSRRYYKKLQEGPYKDVKDVIFEQEKGEAKIFSKGEYKKTVKIQPCSQDILSAVFFVRTVDIQVGDTLNVPLHDVSKSYPLKIKVTRRETVKVPAGTFDCLVVEPFLESEGMFHSKGKIEVYMTNDSRKTPVLMRTEIMIIGHIDAKLKEYRTGK